MTSATSPTSAISTVAVLGTGRMGSSLASTLRRQGLNTYVWNRTAAKLAPLVSLGAQAATTVGEAVSAADLIIVNVNDYDTGDQLLKAPDVVAALRGKVVVDLTSGSPRLARERESWADSHGIAYLDGAIMATPDFIGTPGCTILYAGDVSVFERCTPILLTLGGNTHHVGQDAGHASALDSAILVQMWGSLFGALQGAAVCQAEGLPMDVYRTHTLAAKPVMDAALADLLTRVEAKRFAADEATLASLEAHYGAFKHLLELCDDKRVSRTIPDAFDGFFKEALAAGHAQDDFAALAQFLR